MNTNPGWWFDVWGYWMKRRCFVCERLGGCRHREIAVAEAALFALNKNASNPLKTCAPTVETETAGVESQPLVDSCNPASGAKTAQGPTLAPGQSLEEFCDLYQRCDW